MEMKRLVFPNVLPFDLTDYLDAQEKIKRYANAGEDDLLITSVLGRPVMIKRLQDIIGLKRN